MANTTQYFCQPYSAQKGGIKPEPAILCSSETNARLRAEKIMANNRAVGVDVVRQEADANLGEYGEPEFLVRLGRTPDVD